MKKLSLESLHKSLEESNEESCSRDLGKTTASNIPSLLCMVNPAAKESEAKPFAVKLLSQVGQLGHLIDLTRSERIPSGGNASYQFASAG
ncbi:hypothetical protein EG68_01050 [Paragonimus skrjabini miyazakii]|uniref:Uncharacterized protein n=1 Tax=Paragonimus skrjabini miyazakii TaxID=59628 RepID=A0A8S9ZC98_9TREM|nr:hypothetical protein EG68_01050 [Paragonimus skrjabini miyazakii]